VCSFLLTTKKGKGWGTEFSTKQRSDKSASKEKKEIARKVKLGQVSVGRIKAKRKKVGRNEGSDHG